MDREEFLQILRDQYAEEINEAYLECEHDGGKNIDIEELRKRLHHLLKSAIVEGLRENDFFEIAQSELNQIWDEISLEEYADSAA